MTLTCERCGTTFARRQRRKFSGSLCANRQLAERQRGPAHPTYKGRVQGAGGYIRIYEPTHPIASRDGYVFEHRKVVFDAGIPIPAGHHVHHLNHNKTDNRLENLVVLTPDEHKQIHPSHDGLIENQYGIWHRPTSEERKERRQEYMRRWRHENREHVRAYKAQRAASGLRP